MNYKHSYHAGNFADVVKHILLVQLLNQMSEKGKPYYALDAYAGRGLYKLNSPEARATQESEAGIAKLKAHTNPQNRSKEDMKTMPHAVKHFLSELEYAQQTYDIFVYPGSPWWIANEVGRQASNEKKPVAIRAEAFEAKVEEYDALNYQVHQLPIGIHHRNAFEGIQAVIPPVERRGIILIDPPYEQEHKDFTNLVNLLVACHKKWPQGVFALWYPLKNINAVDIFLKKMKRTDIKKQLICELNVYPNDLPVGMNGTGMLIINPPYQFERHANDILKYLQPILKPADAPAMKAEDAYRVKWLVGEK